MTHYHCVICFFGLQGGRLVIDSKSLILRHPPPPFHSLAPSFPEYIGSLSRRYAAPYDRIPGDRIPGHNIDIRNSSSTFHWKASSTRYRKEKTVQRSTGSSGYHCRPPRFSSCAESRLRSTLDFDLFVHIANFIQLPHLHVGLSHTKPNIPRSRTHLHTPWMKISI